MGKWTDKTKKDQREYKKDIVQPRRDGELSKEYLDTYGTKGVKATDEEIKKARRVWGDLAGWRDRDIDNKYTREEHFRIKGEDYDRIFGKETKPKEI